MQYAFRQKKKNQSIIYFCNCYLSDDCFFSFATELSKAQKTFAKDLREFNFECIDQQTDDEITIGKFKKKLSVPLY